MNEVGVIVIGRNEGDRLRRCLDSVADRGLTVVYVDSGSTDGSVEAARARGAAVVELAMSAPFTAARARNAGVERLRRIDPSVRFIQFVDGDCEVIEGWLDRARDELESRPGAAVVCGRLRERFPDRSVFNRLAECEWDTPVGEVEACGGIAMMRAEALFQVGGFNPAIIAGEEPELCVRLRREGWKVLHLDVDMAWHDMAMMRFGQWWRRSVRSGHAFAEGFALHGLSAERHFVPQVRRVVFWGLLVPMVTAGLAWPTRGASLALLAGYPLLFLRVERHLLRRGAARSDARLYAFFCTLGKFPEAIGMGRYWLGQFAGRRSTLIEYKAAGRAPAEVHP